MKDLDLYLIRTRRNRYILFSPTDVLQQCEDGSDDRVQKFVGWFLRHPNRLVAWAGRALKTGHGYYKRLEDRIDPQERVLKAVNCADHIVRIYSAPNGGASMIEQSFRDLLRRQRWKHIFWISIDTVVCAVVVAFTPILAPIPGPNIFFYYPFLRWLSHYRAIRGAASALRSKGLEFRTLPELSGLEENLQTSRFDQNAVRMMSERLQVRGLEQFLERMV